MFWKKKPTVEMKQSDDAVTTLSSDGESFTFRKEELGALHEQMNEWYKFLNWSIGLVCFGFAQAAHGTPHPPLNALLSAIWISIIYFGGLKTYFPSKLDELRKVKSKLKKPVLKLLEGGYLGIRVMILKLPFFAIGYAYLFFIVLLWVPSMQNFTVSGTKLGDIMLPRECTCIAKPDGKVQANPAVQGTLRDEAAQRP